MHMLVKNKFFVVTIVNTRFNLPKHTLTTQQPIDSSNIKSKGFCRMCTSQYTLCRSHKDQPVIQLNKQFTIPAGATIRIGDTTATIVSHCHDRLKLTNVQGLLPTCATVSYTTHAYHIDKMSQIFQQSWAPFWQRDLPAEQKSDDAWTDLFSELQASPKTAATVGCTR